MLEHILNPPTEEMQAEILKASNEDPGRLEHNMALLERWISSENYLPKNYDRKLLEGYLRGCKHNVETTKRKLEQYFIEKACAEAHVRDKILTIDHDLKITTMIYTFPLPEMTAEGYRIIFRKFDIKNMSLFNMTDLLRYDIMLYDIRLHHDTMTAGQVMIYDVSNSKVPPLQKLLTPDFMRAITFTRRSLPFRLKQFHIITTNSVIIKIVNIVKAIFTEKLANRFYIHRSAEGVFKYIPQRLFPSDYGGSKKSCRELTYEWNAAIMELGDWFRLIREVKISGPIPKDQEWNCSEYFGVEGSFRNLNID